MKIAAVPLSSDMGNVHPNVLLSLSLASPTAGIAYRGNDTYDRTFEYIGYFNPQKCYDYSGGNRNIADGYFFIAKSANTITHECGADFFSGNFMNWVASSTADVLRYALTGGDRIIDLPGITVLQRAVLQDNFYASDAYFPRRSVTGGGNSSAPNRVTPFNVDVLYVVSCRNRILFSDVKAGGNCDTAAKDANGVLLNTDKKLGEYLVRVKVCDDNEGGSRTDLCQRYGDSYKPVGELQRQSERARFAVMGYVLDDAATRYGGVLRAPMKYIGVEKNDDADLKKMANDKLEWNPATGVLYGNPEDPSDRDSRAVNSGIVNYLNKFGRSGLYKNLDPLGELYYEGLRYLQGRQPTAAAAANIIDAMKDGFPVVATDVDPIVASCQKNYIVSIAGAATHWDRYLPGNTRATYHNGLNAYDAVRAIDTAVAGKTPEMDATLWTRKVGEMEADASGFYTNPAARANLADLEKQDTGADGKGSYYPAGLAYWANTHDIRVDKPVRVKTFAVDVDDGGNGLIDGNTRAVKPRDSQLYLAAKYGGFDDRNGDGNPFVTYAADGQTILSGNNSEWDRDNDGIPDNYFLANRPQDLILAIRKIFSGITAGSGTISGVSTSAARMATDDVFVYQPGFNASTWSGSLKKFAVTSRPDGALNIATSADWDASDILTGTNRKTPYPAPDDRKIYTTAVNDRKAATTIEFKWEALTAGQKALLNISPYGIDDGIGEQRVGFLRGVRNLETGYPGGIFRKRDRLLGDIINSIPVYVGAPPANIQGSGYQQFHDGQKNRTKAVYVGANDGMLHAFDAMDGHELFAYVPSMLISTLNQLSDPAYRHRSYVDGGLSVAEAYVAGSWKSILVSGVGGGGQGVFALDVTNPAAFDRGVGALWEFTDNDDPDMGNLLSAPIIAKFKTKLTEGVAEYHYFAVVAGGLNNYSDDGAGKSDAAAPGVLFLLSLEKSASAKWVLGTNYFKFKAPIKDPALQNGLSAPALVTGDGGAVRYAYAGDLQGNLWRFDFTGSMPWPNARSGDTPLFTAMSADGVRQPITTQPKVVFAPGGGYVVLFGTGKFIEEKDAGDFSAQSFYGIYDTTHDQDDATSRDQLAVRVLAGNGDALTIAGSEFIYGIAKDAKKGWYFDFPDPGKTGEKSVTSALTVAGKLFFNSLIPANNPCAKGGGRSYSLDTLTGLPQDGDTTGFLSEVGLLSAPILFDMGTEIGDRNAVGKAVVKRKYAVANFGSGGTKGIMAQARNGRPDATFSVSLPAKRFSWREIVNWQELHSAKN